LQWKKRLVSTPGAFFVPVGVVTDSSNNIYVLISDPGPALPGAAIVKLDPSGNIIWQRKLSGVSQNDLGSISLDSSSNCYVSGPAGSSMAFVKYDSSGVLQWQRIASISSSSLSSIYSLVSIDGIIALQATVFPYIDNKRHMVLSLPTDGSVLGSYRIAGRSFSIQEGSLSDSAASITISNATFLEGSPPSIFGGDPGARSISDLAFVDEIVKI
jgi:hypothetical protein